jgi:hypothetical protein
VAGSLRRRVAGVLALAVGFGVVIGPAPASASALDHSDFSTVTPASFTPVPFTPVPFTPASVTPVTENFGLGGWVTCDWWW